MKELEDEDRQLGQIVANQAPDIQMLMHGSEENRRILLGSERR